MPFSTVDPNELALLAAALGMAGVIAGLIAGLLGVGGGIVVVPVLYHVLTLLGIDESVRMHLSVGTSLAAICATGASSALSHHRKGGIDVGILRSWGPSVLVGALAGAALAAKVDGLTLKAVFGVAALFISAQMAFTRDGLNIGRPLPKGWVRSAIGVPIGGLSAMMGIGGGAFTVPVLSACGFPLRKAVGTASAVGLIIAFPAALGFVITGLGVPLRPPGSLGYVSVLGLVLIIPASVLMAPLGARIAHAIPPRRLRQAFALFLGVTGVKMLSDVFF